MELFKVISTDETTYLTVGDVVKKLSKSDVFEDCVIVKIIEGADEDSVGVIQHISEDMLKKL